MVTSYDLGAGGYLDKKSRMNSSEVILRGEGGGKAKALIRLDGKLEEDTGIRLKFLSRLLLRPVSSSSSLLAFASVPSSASLLLTFSVPFLRPLIA